MSRRPKKFTTTPPAPASCSYSSRPSHILCSGSSCLHPLKLRSDAAVNFALTGAFGKTMTDIKANEVLLACSIGDLAWLKKGLAHGSCPNAINREGLTGLHIAARNGHYECLKYMLNNCGVNINALSKMDRITPLHCSVMHKNGSAMYQCMKILLDRGADHTLKDIHGQTVLHYAAKSGNIKCLKVLLESGVDIHAKDDSGKTAYEIACISNNYELVRLLSSLHWAHKKDEAQNKKLRADQDLKKTESDRKELLARRRAENAEFAFLHWLEIKDFKKPKGPPQECSRRYKSALTPYGRLSSCGTCVQTSPYQHSLAPTSTTTHYRKISTPTKVSHHQEKKNLESIGKPSKMHPYTNFPPKSAKLRKARVGGGGKVAKSQSGKSSTRASSSSTTSSVAKARMKQSREDARTSDLNITNKSRSVKTLVSEVPVGQVEYEQDFKKDSDNKTEQATEYKNTVAATKLDGDYDSSESAHSDNEIDNLDFSRLNDYGYNRLNNATNGEDGLAYPQFDFNFDDVDDDDDETENTFFHDVGDSNDLASLALPAVLTKDKTPAEILQLLKHLSNSGGNTKRSYRRRSYSLSSGGKQFSSSGINYGRRLSLGSIPEGKIVLNYTEEEEVSDIDSQLLRDIESSIKGVEIEETYEVDAPVKELTPSNLPAENTNEEFLESTQTSISVPVMHSESGVETEVKLTLSKPSSPPKTLKIINLAWDESSNSVQSHHSIAPFSSSGKKTSPKLQSPQQPNSQTAVNPPFLIITSPLADKDTSSQKVFPSPPPKTAGPPLSQKTTPHPLGREHRSCKLTPPSMESSLPQSSASSDRIFTLRPPTPAVGGRKTSPLLTQQQAMQPSLSDPCLAGKISKSPKGSFSLNLHDGERRASYPLVSSEGNLAEDRGFEKRSLFSSSSSELSKSMVMSSSESSSSDALDKSTSALKSQLQQAVKASHQVSRKVTPPSRKLTPPPVQYSPLHSSASIDKLVTLRPPTPGVGGRRASPLLQQTIHASSSDPTIAGKMLMAPSKRTRSLSSSSQSDENRDSKSIFFIGEAEESSNDEPSGMEKNSLFSSSASLLSKSMILSSSEPLMDKAEEQPNHERSSSSPGLAKKQTIKTSIFQYDGSLK